MNNTETISSEDNTTSLPLNAVDHLIDVVFASDEFELLRQTLRIYRDIKGSENEVLA